MSQLCAQPTDRLIASYYFTGNAHDTLGNFHGTVRGPKLAPDRFGNQNAAYCFDGEDDYITLGTSTDLRQIVMSISVWAKVNSWEAKSRRSELQPIISARARHTEEYYEAYFVGWNKDAKKLEGSCASLSMQQTGSLAKTPSNLNEWYHVVYMFNLDTAYLYINGEFQQKAYKGFISQYVVGDSVLLGLVSNCMPESKKYNYGWLNGCLDDLKFYNRILTAEEIIALYHEPDPKLTGKTEPLKLKEVLKTFWYIPVGLGIAIIITILISLRLKQVRRRREAEERLKHQALQMEMAALRSQMNPHFIFNALNSIHRYILKNERELASTYLVMFSQLIRNILEFSKSELISLKEELQTIHLYLEIESLRFERSFDYAVDISENVDQENIMVPALIVQPFVENAIWHGLLPKPEEKKLSIRVYKRSGEIILEIDDNGIGREAAKQYGEKTKKRLSLGLEITEDRLEVLKKIYGIDISYQIIDKKDNSGKAEGTKVIINIKYNPI